MRGLMMAGLLVLVGLCLPGAALAGEGCPNEQLRAENNSLGLPDCRAYEMVTPPDKQGAVVTPALEQSPAADGSSVVGSSPEAFAGIESDEQDDTNVVFYRFTRTASGWVTMPLTPYRGEPESIGVGDSVWRPSEVQVSVERLRLRAADGSVSEIGPVWPPVFGVNGSHYSDNVVVGVAAEAVNGVVFRAGDGLLWPFDSTRSGGSLYEYRGTGNVAPSLVGVSGGVGSTALVSQCGTQFGGISEDGGRVFFMAVGADSNPCGGTQPSVNELFARVGGSETVAISEPTQADCVACKTSEPRDAVFRGASVDGSVVFFTTSQALLGSDTSENLYEYDFDAPVGQRVVRVSGGDGTVSDPVAEVQDVTVVSGDGSHVYFTARGVLTRNPNAMGETAQVGAENLYVYERDAQYPAGRTVFVTDCSDVGGGESERQVTPDGRFLVFTSACHLTPGDTGSTRQVFQYDAQTGGLVRVSVGLDGYNGDGNITGGENYEHGLAARIAAGRTESDDGSRVFFQSPVGLTPQALNEVQAIESSSGLPVYAENVYEFHDGRVSLIGSDSSPPELHNDGFPRVLVGMGASGGDVFFRTGDQAGAAGY